MLKKLKSIQLYIKQYFLKLACFLVAERTYIRGLYLIIPILLSGYYLVWNRTREIIRHQNIIKQINLQSITNTQQQSINTIHVYGLLVMFILFIIIIAAKILEVLYHKTTVPNKLNKAKLENLDKINILRDYEILKNKIENSKIITKKNKNYL